MTVFLPSVKEKSAALSHLTIAFSILNA